MSLPSFVLPIASPILAGVIIFYFLYHFITMTTVTPFKTMKAIYVYLAALIGLVVVALGLYGLLWHLLGVLFTDSPFNSGFLVSPLAQIIVGLFVMLPHWAIGHHFHAIEHGKRK